MADRSRWRPAPPPAAPPHPTRASFPRQQLLLGERVPSAPAPHTPVPQEPRLPCPRQEVQPLHRATSCVSGRCQCPALLPPPSPVPAPGGSPACSRTCLPSEDSLDPAQKRGYEDGGSQAGPSCRDEVGRCALDGRKSQPCGLERVSASLPALAGSEAVPSIFGDRSRRPRREAPQWPLRPELVVLSAPLLTWGTSSRAHCVLPPPPATLGTRHWPSPLVLVSSECAQASRSRAHAHSLLVRADARWCL